MWPLGGLQRDQGRGRRPLGLAAQRGEGKIKVTTVKPTGVLGTNLGRGVVNGAAIMGIVGSRGESYMRSVTAFAEGNLEPEQTDIDSVKYWLITPKTSPRRWCTSSISPGASVSVTSPCERAAKTTSTDVY